MTPEEIKEIRERLRNSGPQRRHDPELRNLMDDAADALEALRSGGEEPRVAEAYIEGIVPLLYQLLRDADHLTWDGESFDATDKPIVLKRAAMQGEDVLGEIKYQRDRTPTTETDAPGEGRCPECGSYLECTHPLCSVKVPQNHPDPDEGSGEGEDL